MKQFRYLPCGLVVACVVSPACGGAGILIGGLPNASLLGPLTTCALLMALSVAAALALMRPSGRAVMALNVLAMVAIVGTVLWPVYALAQEAGSTTVNVGSLFGDMRGSIEAVLGAVVAGILGWIALLAKKNTGLSIDGKMRDMLHSAAMNGVHLGLDKVQSYADTKNLDVKSTVIADGIGYVRRYAPQAVKHFGLGEDDLTAIVKAKLAQLQPAEAAAVGKATGA